MCRADSTLLPDANGFCISLHTTDTSKFVPHTKATVAGMVNRLAEIAATGDTRALEAKQEQWGYMHEAHSWLLDASLGIDLVKIFAWDWFHCYLEKGVFSHEQAELMDLLGRGWVPSLCTYLQKWQRPAA